MHEIKWEKSLNKEHVKASSDFLTLLFEKKEVERMAQKLEKHKKDLQKFKAKDILRASNTQLLPETNEDVRNEFRKIVRGEKLFPVALVRCAGRLLIADGYHRTCAAYYLNKDMEVHCILVGDE